MFKLIKRLICLIVIASIVFFWFALRSGGEKFRWFGEKTGGVIKEKSEKLAERADVIKKEKDKALQIIKKITGGNDATEDSGRDKQPGKNIEDASRETSKKQIKEPETVSGKEDGNKTVGNSQHSLWNTILEKIKALTKG